MNEEKGVNAKANRLIIVSTANTKDIISTRDKRVCLHFQLPLIMSYRAKSLHFFLWVLSDPFPSPSVSNRFSISIINFSEGGIGDHAK